MSLRSIKVIYICNEVISNTWYSFVGNIMAVATQITPDQVTFGNGPHAAGLSE